LALGVFFKNGQSLFGYAGCLHNVGISSSNALVVFIGALAPLFKQWGYAEGSDRRGGGDWERTDDYITRFEPSASFRFGFDFKGVGLASETLFG
jgi:hypothetical protein